MYDTRPAGGLLEGRLPYASGLTVIACVEFESNTKGYHDLTQAVRKYVHPEYTRATCEEIFTRMVFNIFVSNDDDHLRNHSFLRDPRKGGWLLSPLYYVVPRTGVSYERMLHLQIGQQGRHRQRLHRAAGQRQRLFTLGHRRGTVAQQKATGAFMEVTSAQGGKLVSAQSPVAGVTEAARASSPALANSPSSR